MDQTIVKEQFNFLKATTELLQKEVLAFIHKKHQRIMVVIIETMFHHLEVVLATMSDQIKGQVEPLKEQANPH